MPQRQTCGSFTKNTFAMMKPQLTYYDISHDTTAFSTTRHGGHSTGNYAELNINRYCGDNSEDIERTLKTYAVNSALTRSVSLCRTRLTARK